VQGSSYSSIRRAKARRIDPERKCEGGGTFQLRSKKKLSVFSTQKKGGEDTAVLTDGEKGRRLGSLPGKKGEGLQCNEEKEPGGRLRGRGASLWKGKEEEKVNHEHVGGGVGLEKEPTHPEKREVEEGKVNVFDAKTAREGEAPQRRKKENRRGP